MQRTVVQLLDFHPHSQRSMEVFLVALAHELRSRGWRTVHVVAGEPGDYFRDQLEQIESPCIVTEFPLSLLKVYPLGKQLRAYLPDVIHTSFLSNFDPRLWMLKRFARAQYLIMADHSSGTASTKRGLKRVLSRMRGSITGLCINQIVAVSNFVRNRDIQAVHLPAKKIRTIYNGVDLEKFQAVKRIPYEVFTIAFVGQLIPEKGVLILLRAINELTADSPTVFHVLIAGQGSQESELRDYCRANRMNHVQFLGQIDWVDRLYRCVDIVVVPSQWDEACAFSIIEAMACGACIVASNAGGNPELIGPDGTAGVLFHKSNVTELKQKLRELLCNRDRRIAIGTAALERANKMFSLKRMVGEYVRLYEELDALKNY